MQLGKLVAGQQDLDFQRAALRVAYIAIEQPGIEQARRLAPLGLLQVLQAQCVPELGDLALQLGQLGVV